MENCKIGGYHVPAGTRLLVNVWKIQRDPSFWTNPTAFQPERYITNHKDVDVRGQHYELLPFGSGRRSCPGASFALHALQLTLARFLHEFDLATPNDQPVDMTETPGTTLPKATPLEVLLSPRLSAKLYSCWSFKKFYDSIRWYLRWFEQALLWIRFVYLFSVFCVIKNRFFLPCSAFPSSLQSAGWGLGMYFSKQMCSLSSQGSLWSLNHYSVGGCITNPIRLAKLSSKSRALHLVGR